MRPERDNIAAPVLPPRLRWVRPPGAEAGAEPDPVLAELTAAGPVLVHFFDFAQLNSVRALPYPIAWEARYGAAGLTVLGVHSPRFGFTGERDALGPALARLGIRHPVADDSAYAVWHDYGCRGWPSLFLWGQGGALRWSHFGEGEYQATEEAIAAELTALDPEFVPPAPLEPLRPSDAPGALVVPPSDEILPGGSVSDPWPGERQQRTLELEYAAGGAHASVAGEGELRVVVDGGAARTVTVTAPALHDLAIHPRHEAHAIRLEVGAGVEVYSVSFSAGLP
ncbi:MAG: hypothetical protein ACHQJ5_06175 [Vicinamibacteria bacterium]|jgi:hypothetical protein